ncbi:MAG TPA: hypothetical protein PKV71_12510 [Calditrichia bacterium]|nr:flagellar biosynthesis anti-sigma factor FlgM [Calditrichota bacterium]HQV32697.1 hypothetical protein [Calditrichia bacterium]
MGPIKSLGGLPQEPKKVEKAENKLRATSEKAYQQGRISGEKVTRQDRAEISSTAREMLNIKELAEKYRAEGSNTSVLSREEMEMIREKVAEGHYNSEQVADDLVNRLVGLPNFVRTSGE